MKKPIRMCIDRILPESEVVTAAARAIALNPSNMPLGAAMRDMSVPGRLRMALVAGKRWTNGKALKVRFLDGDAAVKQKVEAIAQQWSQHANITFAFGNAQDAEIRISFQQEGSWSAVGTDALNTTYFPIHEPTMNFGWLTPQSADAEYERVVLHEFGHALGSIHEHQSPGANIPWDTEAVYSYFGGPPNNWSREEIEHNLLRKYSGTSTNFSAFDRASIMLYPIDNSLTIGDYEVGLNRALSETDKAFIRSQYPKAAPGLPPLEIGGRAVDGAIGMQGEQDAFQFSVRNDGRYVVETQGATDVVMALFGPDDQTRWVAEDDDSGRGLNARIVSTLKPGTYFIRLRHYRRTGTGGYKIAVRTA